MFSTLYQIAKNTFRESLREPIFLLVLVSALVLIGVYPSFTLFVFNAHEKLIVDSAMATMMVFGWGLAIMISSYAISREIDNGTALLLLSKPVQRPVFIIAKILGILASTTVFCFITGVATLIALRVATDQFWFDDFVFYGFFVVMALALALAGAWNYVTRSSFCMAAVLALLVLIPVFAVIAHFKPTDGNHVGLVFRAVPALILVMFSVWSMGTLATALSTRFNLVPNLLLCGALFMLGLMSDYLIGRLTREPWQRLPPAGKQQLWIARYKFLPSETADIEKWEEPQRIEDFGQFIVWTDAPETAAALDPLGKNPAASWHDGHGWHHDPNQLSTLPLQMAVYNSANPKQPWTLYNLGSYADAKRKAAKDAGELDALIFRRSANPPRTPEGGTIHHPVPASGNWVATALYAAVPNWQLFWMADALSSRGGDQEVNTNEATVPARYVGYAAAYATILNLFLVLLAILLFWNREAGRQSLA